MNGWDLNPQHRRHLPSVVTLPFCKGFTSSFIVFIILPKTEFKVKKMSLTNYMVTVGKVGRIENDKSEYIKIR
ncbi:hypothetical protein CBLAS_0367 [Campylobacter blaseri]|uniref:Uncharacterized protein n=1 Tax=Campylobacter blaseri TaxID=2042961 RepID=A0A2P8R1J6_9BACT|nr:hypothetical protein CQ405_04745 [Campylobacter blaseri]PSM54127.1 hypothetical protein CRN67_04745 [Campylobacter blaseri]QKF85571.1 hypothetical protein CBLAS_0367 [Campylobacter blaseri]